ncbi:hypothetical protein [Streptosporangium sp. NPDC002721]|uniref:hypothetical protein n=1 Tax=Streptosporangium sp. NPDC002721 TaxID=3366188 RepID=UPI003697B9C8
MKQVFRSTLATVVGWVWMAFAAFNAVDLIARYSGQTSMIAAAVLGVLTAVVFVTCLRPAVILSEEGVHVRNPLRNAFVSWPAVDEVTVSHSIAIVSGDESVRCWVPQASARERAAAVRRGKPAPAPSRGRSRTEPVRSKGEQAAAEALAGRTHADWVAEQITERAEAARRAAALTATAAATEATKATGTSASAAAGVESEDEATAVAEREAEPTTAVGTGAETGREVEAGGLKVTWSPSALAAFAAAVLLVVAAFLA